MAPDGTAVTFADTNGNLFILDGTTGLAWYGYNRTNFRLYGTNFLSDSSWCLVSGALFTVPYKPLWFVLNTTATSYTAPLLKFRLTTTVSNYSSFQGYLISATEIIASYSGEQFYAVDDHILWFTTSVMTWHSKLTTDCNTCTITGSKFAVDLTNNTVISIWAPKVFSTVYMYCAYMVLNYSTGAQITTSKFPY